MAKIKRIAAIASLLGAVDPARGASPPVDVALRTSWPAPPLLLEVIETVSTENHTAFFPLLDALLNPEIFPAQLLAPEAEYSYALEGALAGGFLSQPTAQAAAELGLALHASTPLIAAFYAHHADRLGGEVHCGGAWVDWYGEIICDAETLAGVTSRETIDAADGTNTTTYARPKTLTFDHIFPPPETTPTRPPRTAILYASLDAPSFWELHELLYERARAADPHLEYIFRHVPSRTKANGNAAKSYLTGYGVALDLKKTDYLAVDDRYSEGTGEKAENERAGEGAVPADPILAFLDQYPVNDTLDTTSPFSADELFEVSLQAAQLIMSSPTPLATLKRLTHDFPAYAPLLRRVQVSDALREEIHANQLRVQGGSSQVWINGAAVREGDVSPFGLLRLMRKERPTITALTELGFAPPEAVALVSHPALATAQAAGGATDGLVDASDRPEGEQAIVYWNDLETDSRYENWQSTLSLLLRPMYPGQFPPLKLNIYNVVLTLDLSLSSSLNFVTNTVSNIIQRGFPFRWGLVPVVETPEGTQMARLFYWCLERYGRAKTMQFLRSVQTTEYMRHTVDWDRVRTEFGRFVKEVEPKHPDSSDEVPSIDTILSAGTGDALDARVEKARVYATRLSADVASAEQGHAFVNGKHFDMNDNFLRSMQNELAQQLNHLQEQMYMGKISDDDPVDISTYFYDLPTTAKRRNRHIVPAADALKIVSLPQLFERSGFEVAPRGWVYPPGAEPVIASLLVLADLDSEDGVKVVKEVLRASRAGLAARVSFVHNPSRTASDEANTQKRGSSWLIAHLIAQGKLFDTSPELLLRALGLDDGVPTSEEPVQTVLSGEGSFGDLTGGLQLADIDDEEYKAYIRACSLVAREIGATAGENMLLVNGRVVGPFQSHEMTEDDIQILLSYELQKRIQPVIEAVQGVLDQDEPFDRITLAHTISVVSSIVTSMSLPDPSEVGLLNTPQRPRNMNYRTLADEHSVFQFGDNDTSIFQISVLVDPISESAQKWVDIIEWLSKVPGVLVDVRLNPGQYRELPLKRFYRNSFIPRLAFDEEGNEDLARTVFDNLPVDPIYTLAMDVPSSWLVRPRQALHDLDNIHLSTLTTADRVKGVEAVFDLDFLVIEGHARDIQTQAPPRGVQLELTKGNSVIVDDTHVAATLGYFQFKAEPGVFNLRLREGRSSEIFTIESVGNEGWDSPSVEEVGDEVEVTSFEGLTLYPRLARKPGMEFEDVLHDWDDEDDESKGVLSGMLLKVASLFKPKPTEVAVVKGDQADINIFTVASGLLYERFVGIMILSVMKNTNSSVKFWFIENFLSPSFLEFIPHLAEAYGFKYELVTYKWPHWLRAQKEKQRIIWAYKILFLDVLFPMDLKKVIFVDADQIVRADLKELVDLDLHGAPYGYTPMGDDNTDMEGFRFWKTGYWKDFLKGRPYHISALYVVDLVRFRQMAAGDMLRAQYQQLSADPNSLSNLDQDLPNNLQREVPIFSLPEDWLWCETWCSKDRLHRAKTIDLCQNPLTKEPKLARARQIPEWEEYDSEISRFAKSLAEKGLIRSGIAATDANTLAGDGSALAEPVEEAAGDKPPAEGEKPRVEDQRTDKNGESPGRDEL